MALHVIQLLFDYYHLFSRKESVVMENTNGYNMLTSVCFKFCELHAVIKCRGVCHSR